MKRVITIIALTTLALSLTGCAAWERQMKTMESNYGGGLNRTVTVYDENGKPIKSWEGQIDVQSNTDSNGDTNGTKVLFDLNGKRVIIYNAPVIIEEK